jgi:hypothetical protein
MNYELCIINYKLFCIFAQNDVLGDESDGFTK